MSVDRVNGFFGSVASRIKMDGVANPGTSTYSAREDHVHPKDTSMASAEHTHDGVAIVQDGVVFGVTKSVAVEDWVSQGEGTSYDVAVSIPGLNSGSIVQLFPMALTFTAFDALAITVKSKDTDVLTLTTTTLPSVVVELNVLYTKPTVELEPDPEPAP